LRSEDRWVRFNSGGILPEKEIKLVASNKLNQLNLILGGDMRENQLRVLSVIDDLKNELGVFPTYREIAEKMGLTKQSIEQKICRIINDITNYKPKDVQFADYVKLTKNGWVSYTVYIKDGSVVDERVSSGKQLPMGI